MAYLVEHGLSGMSFRTLGEAVGVSHVTLRHHFGTKEQLLAEVFAAIRDRESIPAPTAGVDGRQVLRDLWQWWSTPEGSNHFKLFFEAYGYAMRQPERHQVFFDVIVSDWLRQITGFAEQFGYAPDEAEGFATVVLAQLRGLQLDLLATGDHDRVGAALDLFIRRLG
jgi:AcrR family transcriptional regulator